MFETDSINKTLGVKCVCKSIPKLNHEDKDESNSLATNSEYEEVTMSSFLLAFI